MVRINILNPKCLSDQHLIAEYNEILMLAGYVRKYPNVGVVPRKYCLGKGHILFFKNKLIYLYKRHNKLADEMGLRGFHARKSFTLKKFDKALLNDWKPTNKDRLLIKKRIVSKIRLKPDWYRYCGANKSQGFFLRLLDQFK
jgi:deoxyribonuclease (pyrimidine dimer)